MQHDEDDGEQRAQRRESEASAEEELAAHRHGGVGAARYVEARRARA